MKKEEKIVEIVKIKIRLPSQEVELSIEDARKIYEELTKLFESEKEVNELAPSSSNPEKIYIPYPYWPIDTTPNYPPPYRPWEITWCGGGDGVTTVKGLPGETLCMDLT